MFSTYFERFELLFVLLLLLMLNRYGSIQVAYEFVLDRQTLQINKSKLNEETRCKCVVIPTDPRWWWILFQIYLHENDCWTTGIHLFPSDFTLNIKLIDLFIQTDSSVILEICVNRIAFATAYPIHYHYSHLIAIYELVRKSNDVCAYVGADCHSIGILYHKINMEMFDAFLSHVSIDR